MQYLNEEQQFEVLLSLLMVLCGILWHSPMYRQYIDERIDEMAYKYSWDIQTREEFAHLVYERRSQLRMQGN